MKKYLCIFTALLLVLCGCSRKQEDTPATTLETTAPAIYDTTFQMDEDGNLISPSGIVYSFLAQEPNLYYLGELQLAGYVEGEEPPDENAYVPRGIYVIKDAAVDLNLVRYAPNNEWYMIYRDISLPECNFTWDNCTRLELITPFQWPKDDGHHASCNGGITNKEDVDAFLSELRIQLSPQETGLRVITDTPQETESEIYLYGQLYGYFEEDPNLIVIADVWSFGDQAYSVKMGNIEYVLTSQLYEQLLNTKCAD